MNRVKAFFLIPAIAFLFSNCDEHDTKPKNSFQVSDYIARKQIATSVTVPAVLLFY